jgi:hypothetical protein
MKKLLIILASVAVFLIIVVIIAFSQVNRIVKKRIELGVSYALGVNTTLNNAKIGIMRGESTISGLNVSNPDGFKSNHFMTMKKADVALTVRALLRHKVEVSSLTLDGIDINLEKQHGKANYNVIMENLTKFEGSLPQQNGKKFIIRDLTIRDIKITVDLLPIGGNLTRTEANIPEIHLKDVGSDTNQGILLSELSGVVTKAVFASLVEKGVNLPGEVLKDLGKGLAGLASVGKFGLKVVGKVTIKTFEIAGDVIKGVGKGLEKGVEGIGKGIENILDKNKKDK